MQQFMQCHAQNLRFCHSQHRRVVEGLLPDARLLPHLTDLVLKGCMAGPKMPGVVAGLTSLERLSLKSSEFGGGLPPFSSLSRLTFCNLSYCSIDDYRPPLQVCARQLERAAVQIVSRAPSCCGQACHEPMPCPACWTRTAVRCANDTAAACVSASPPCEPCQHPSADCSH